MTELAAWYQRKIGTYDKQEWETTIEQRLNDMAQIPLKSARLRPELIDVDLVRGSSFPKAKPIQGLATVVRLALCRVLLLPLWMRWWSLHTSRPAASFLLGLWLLQLLNTALYIMAPPSTHLDASCVLVPLSLMAGLGVVHALIVSTGPPLSSSYRFRSLNIEERRNRRRLSAQPEGILRQESSFSSDIINSSSDITQLNIKQTKCLNRGRKTTSPVKENIPINTDNKKDEWVNGFRIPTVRLSPPLGQSVSFDLREKEWEGSDESSKEDDAAESPVHLRRRNQQNVPEEPVVHEGDDGFESLNGNNSNGSENGEDSKVDKILFENKLKKRNVMKLENDCDENVKDICDTKHVEDASVASGSTEMFGDCLSQDGGRVLSDDGGSSTNLSVEHGRKRDRRNKGGAKFRNSWVQELLEQRPPLSEGKTRKPRKEWKSPPSSSSGEECDTASASIRAPSQQTDWVGQTTNSEECSYSSEHEESEWEGYTGDPAWEPCAILSPASDRVSCTFWENGRALKAHMSAVDISRAIVGRAERHLDRAGSGLWPGTLLAALLAALPPAARLLQVMVESEAAGSEQVTLWDLPGFFFMNSPLHLLCSAFGDTSWERTISLISVILRLGLGALVFFLLAVAERAFRQRFLYAKLFSHLTSARRARQSALPHFRLNRVRNIKTWLSVRSYLKRRGPQRSVDVIVSAAFFMMVLLISFLVIELLKDPGQVEGHRAAEALGWVLALGAVLIQLAALGTRAARKHRCLPVLLTEQINLHLAMERRPASKDRLAVANNVLKLAADLLKELESPFKISGLSANPYLYTITKVVVLSALSGVLSEILGFKLKLHKIKIK